MSCGGPARREARTACKKTLHSLQSIPLPRRLPSPPPPINPRRLQSIPPPRRLPPPPPRPPPTPTPTPNSLLWRVTAAPSSTNRDQSQRQPLSDLVCAGW
ncbi:hypothetical protein SEVIR_4G293350v4 [Setaria viridis]